MAGPRHELASHIPALATWTVVGLAEHTDRFELAQQLQRRRSSHLEPFLDRSRRDDDGQLADEVDRAMPLLDGIAVAAAR